MKVQAFTVLILRACEPSRQARSGQFGLDKASRAALQPKDRLGCLITAADRTFHRCRPACLGPIAGNQQVWNRRLLMRPPLIAAGLWRKCRGILANDNRADQFRSANGWD